jgi:hypothetical protein
VAEGLGVTARAIRQDPVACQLWQQEMKPETCCDPTKKSYHKDKEARFGLGLLSKLATLKSAFLKLIR